MTLHLTLSGHPCIITLPDLGGQTRIRGRVWRWEYSIGGFFALLRANGEPMSLNAYPGPRHPLWRAVRRWERKNRPNA